MDASGRRNIIDGGAYLGSFALLASKIVGDDRLVIAFEPIERNYSRLVKNIHLNRIHNVIPINKGLWWKSGEIPFVEIHDGMSTVLMEHLNEGKYGTMEVTTIKEELERLGIDHFDFLKLDVEGAEIEILEDLVKSGLLRTGTKMAIASYHIVNGQQTRYRIEEILRDNGFIGESVQPDHWTTLVDICPQPAKASVEADRPEMER